MSAPAPEPRPRFTSLSEIGTSRIRQLLQQSDTTIIRGLWTLAPKRRRARVRWVVGVALLAVAGVLAADRSIREYLIDQGRETLSTRRAAESTPASAPAARSSIGAALPTSAEKPPEREAVSWPAVGIAIPPSSAAGGLAAAPATVAPVSASATASASASAPASTAFPRPAPATAKPKGRPHASFARATHKPPSGG